MSQTDNTTTIRIGTDCSGVEAPIQALRKLGVEYRSIFASDIDHYARSSIRGNYKPETLYEDMTERDNATLGDIDLYVCGFPCQPFSTLGRGGGMNEERGQVFFHCLDVIRKKKPKYFLLENVRGILSNDKGRTIKRIDAELAALDEYFVDRKLLNSRDYGVPQNRPRVFFVGIRKDCLKREFAWPEPMEMKTTLQDVIDWNDTKPHTTGELPMYIQEFLDSVRNDECILATSTFPGTCISGHLWSQCLTTNRPPWVIALKRFANNREVLRLQGFPEDYRIVVSRTQHLKQMGNSMTVDVIAALFREMFHACE